MRHVLTSFAVVIVLAASHAAAASTPAAHAAHAAHAGHAAGHGASHGAPAAPRPAFEALDANRDGRLDKAELARHPLAAHATMADADRNGTLDRREFATLSAM